MRGGVTAKSLPRCGGYVQKLIHGAFHFSLARDHRDTFERSSLVCAGAVAASRTRVDRGWIRKSRSATGGLNLESECRAIGTAARQTGERTYSPCCRREFGPKPGAE